MRGQHALFNSSRLASVSKALPSLATTPFPPRTLQPHHPPHATRHFHPKRIYPFGSSSNLTRTPMLPIQALDNGGVGEEDMLKGAWPRISKFNARELLGLRGMKTKSSEDMYEVNEALRDPTTSKISIDERRAHVQRSLEAGTLGLGFSGGGFLFCYHLGVLCELHEMGLLKDRLSMAGASAGSLAITIYNSGIGMDTATRGLKEFASECRKNGTSFRLTPLLKDFLHEYLPSDTHKLCSGVCHVAITRLFPYFKPEVISEFDSKDDLITALATSCHIPMYANGNWATSFRGRLYVDGGVRNFIPSPPGAKAVVKVCCLPVHETLERMIHPTVNSVLSLKYQAYAQTLLDVSISPDAFEPFPHSYQDVLRWAMLPAPDDTLDMLIAKGRKDARAWADSMCIGGRPGQPHLTPPQELIL